jgi:cell division protein FtsB
MDAPNNMRKQVETELRVRNYIVKTLLIISLLFVGGTLVFRDTGLLRYLELNQKQVVLEQELQLIETQNAQLKASLVQYKADSYYLEKYARENFGLSKPDELLFIYKE